MLFQDLLRGKIFGHPIHIMLVHFPAALLPTAAAIDAIREFGGISLPSAELLLWPGVVIGWLAVAFGLWDLLRLPAASPEMARGLLHGGINATAVAGFTWALLGSINTTSDAGTSIRVWIEIICALMIFVGNKFGGDLLLRFGVGQMKRSVE